MNAILLMFHLEQDAGYAIDSLCSVFVRMAKRLVSDSSRIHLSFTSLSQHAESDASGMENIIAFDPSSTDGRQHVFIHEYVRRHRIDLVFGFDQPVRQPSYRHLRKAGVRKIVSYQGAPMSSLNSGLMLLLKRLDVLLAADSPDHYIFESHAMADTACRGRGIPQKDISIVRLGVDTERFRPAQHDSHYAHDAFQIPRERRIVYYSGHMAERKGVAVLVRAAMYLYQEMQRRDFHFLILGNRAGEEQQYLDMLSGSEAGQHVTFGGYRSDVQDIIPSCYAGAIASTGWDSFTMSSLEIAACGLPLIVSRLQGLSETVDEGETGYMIKPGEHVALAQYIAGLLDDPVRRDTMGSKARDRVIRGFSREMQIDRLVEVVRAVAAA